MPKNLSEGKRKKGGGAKTAMEGIIDGTVKKPHPWNGKLACTKTNL